MNLQKALNESDGLKTAADGNVDKLNRKIKIFKDMMDSQMKAQKKPWLENLAYISAGALSGMISIFSLMMAVPAKPTL